MTTNSVVDTLNRAYATDPDAIHALIVNRVPCNRALADDPSIVVESTTITGNPHVGMLGVINGLLGDTGQSLVAVKWRESDEEGCHKLLGFQVFSPAVSE